MCIHMPIKEVLGQILVQFNKKICVTLYHPNSVFLLS
jgi:hypothetical protein